MTRLLAVLCLPVAVACGAQVRPRTSARTQLGEGAALTKAAVDEVITSHVGAVTDCYERFAKAEGRPMGVVRLGWQVEPSGAVSDVQVVSTTLRSTAIEQCVAGEVGRWSFPKASQRTEVVEHPFTF